MMVGIMPLLSLSSYMKLYVGNPLEKYLVEKNFWKTLGELDLPKCVFMKEKDLGKDGWKENLVYENFGA